LFPSAISRYLVSNKRLKGIDSLLDQRVSIRYIAVLGFQQGCYYKQSTPTARFHPLYRGTWFPTEIKPLPFTCFSSRFHPLYRGTWFPTCT